MLGAVAPAGHEFKPALQCRSVDEPCVSSTVWTSTEKRATASKSRQTQANTSNSKQIQARQKGAAYEWERSAEANQRMMQQRSAAWSNKYQTNCQHHYHHRCMIIIIVIMLVSTSSANSVAVLAQMTMLQFCLFCRGAPRLLRCARSHKSTHDGGEDACRCDKTPHRLPRVQYAIG